MIKLLVDISLSPDWVDVFATRGWPAAHWSTVGDPTAADRTLMAWAREHGGYVVFTHDLDFGTLLALTRATGPSVIQVRAQDVLPVHLGQTVVTTIRAYESQLREGAIVTIDESRGKVRLLPIPHSPIAERAGTISRTHDGVRASDKGASRERAVAPFAPPP